MGELRAAETSREGTGQEVAAQDFVDRRWGTGARDPDSIQVGPWGGGWGLRGQVAATVAEGGGATWAGAGVWGWGTAGVRVPHPAPPTLHGWGSDWTALCLSLCSTSVLSAAHISRPPGLWPVSLGGEG